MVDVEYLTRQTGENIAREITRLNRLVNKLVADSQAQKKPGTLGNISSVGPHDQQCFHCQTKWYFKAVDDIPAATMGGSGCEWQPGVGLAQVLKIEGTLASPCIKIPGEAFGDGWTTATAYDKGDSVSHAGNNYIAETAGTSGGSPPVHTAGIVSDGGVDWRFAGAVAAADPPLQVVNPTCWPITHDFVFTATKQDGQPFAVDPGNTPPMAEFTLAATLAGDAYGDGELQMRCSELPPEPVLDLAMDPVIIRLYNPCSEIEVTGAPVRVRASPTFPPMIDCCPAWQIILVCC